MAAPSATTSFTFAPKQKVKLSARFTGKRNHRGDNKKDAVNDGENGEDGDVEKPQLEEEIVVCSFAQSSRVVDAWIKEATKERKIMEVGHFNVLIEVCNS